MSTIRFFFQFLLRIFFKLLFVFTGEPKISKNLAKTNQLYANKGFSSLFAKIRSWDAPYDAVEKLVPAGGRVLDLGSGDGLMANFLAISSSKREVTGFELNSQRVKESYLGLKNTHFFKGDITKAKLPKAETVLLIHVLHHLPSRKHQELLIGKISQLLGKSGKLIILEIDSQPFLKYVFSFLTDAIIVPILFEKRLFSFDFYYRNKEEWVRLLKENGFTVEKTKAIHKGMPFSHVLINSVKK